MLTKFRNRVVEVREYNLPDLFECHSRFCSYFCVYSGGKNEDWSGGFHSGGFTDKLEKGRNWRTSSVPDLYNLSSSLSIMLSL